MDIVQWLMETASHRRSCRANCWRLVDWWINTRCVFLTKYSATRVPRLNTGLRIFQPRNLYYVTNFQRIRSVWLVTLNGNDSLGTTLRKVLLGQCLGARQARSKLYCSILTAVCQKKRKKNRAPGNVLRRRVIINVCHGAVLYRSGIYQLTDRSDNKFTNQPTSYPLLRLTPFYRNRTRLKPTEEAYSLEITFVSTNRHE